MGINMPDIYEVTRIGLVCILIVGVVVTLWATYDWDKHSEEDKNFEGYNFFYKRGK